MNDIGRLSVGRLYVNRRVARLGSTSSAAENIILNSSDVAVVLPEASDEQPLGSRRRSEDTIFNA